jgi:hypothetical protein
MLPAGAPPRLPNMQDLQALLAIVLPIAERIRRVFAPQIPRLDQPPVQQPAQRRRRPEEPIPEREARVWEDLGKSFQEDLFLIVDHVTQGQDENIARQGKIIVNQWKTLRQLIHEIVSVVFPPSRMATPLPTPTMDHTTEKNVRQALSSATWTIGRNLVVNVGSNTISVFDLGNQIEDNLEDIPLSIHGVPIIPHSFQEPTPTLDAPPLLDATDELDPQGTLCDGLSDEELNAVRKYFPGLLQSIEFFFDRVVILTVGTDCFTMCLEKIGGTSFRAFGCVFVLLAVGESVRRGRRKSPPEDLVSPGGVRPGSKIYNEGGGFSTLGAFLVDGKDYPTSEYLLTWFTVSAHSFLRKRPFKIGSWSTMLVVPVIAKIALKLAMTSFFGVSVCRQYLLARVCIWSWELVWKFWGFKLGWHGMVCVMSPLLTF